MSVRASTTSFDPVVVATATSYGTRLAWSGVWSGFLVAVGVFLLLSVLGLAVGVTAVDTGAAAAGNAREAGIGAAVWSGAALLISLFLGGMAATRSGMVSDAAAGSIEGVLIWVLSILTLIYMAGSGFALLSRGVFGALGTVTVDPAAAAAAVRSVGDAQATIWAAFAAMVLSLLAALGGAMVGRRQVLRRIAGVRIDDRAGRGTP